MGAGKSGPPSPSVKLFRLSHVRKLRDCEQVAAVCYRVRGVEIEFLLVRTNNGHWTFPKGGIEPGLTHAQAAALEAFEEAGVHGRMEEASFARYIRRKDGRRKDIRNKKSEGRDTPEIEVRVSAHLCEVLRLSAPQESGRNPTWFSSEKTKRRLGEDRTIDFTAELVRVVDRAVARIQRSRGGTATTDGLQKVRFEAFEKDGKADREGQVSYTRSITVPSPAVPGRMGDAVGLGPVLVVNGAPVRMKRLSGGQGAGNVGKKSE